MDIRITDPVAIEPARLQAVIEAGNLPILQFSRPGYSRELLRAVNQACRTFGDRLEIRFYSHYPGRFDAAALEELPDVRRLSLDCITEIVNEQQIPKLRSLISLSFGVFQFDNTKFLDSIDFGPLTSFSVSETKKRNFDLAPLANGKNLESLFIQGHTKNIEVLSSLPKLNELVLVGYPNQKALQFLNGVSSLRSLKLQLGGRTSLDEFQHAALEELIILRVRGVATIGALQRLPSLRRLHVEDQLQIGSIDLAGAPLQRVVLLNCKNLARIEGLDGLDALTELRIAQTQLDLDPLVNRDWPTSMKVLSLRSGSRERDEAARAILDSKGYREFGSRP